MHCGRTLADNITKNSGKGKNKSAKLEVRPFMVKNYLWVFVNSMITNPTFDSQVCLDAIHKSTSWPTH